MNPYYPPPNSLVVGLKKLGHTFTNKTAISVVQAIYKDGGDIYAVSDPRKYGKTCRLLGNNYRQSFIYRTYIEIYIIFYVLYRNTYYFLESYFLF